MYQIRHFGVVAIMALQLAGVVIPRQIEIVQPRHNAVIHDLNNIRLLHVLRHTIDRCAIFGKGRRTKTVAITLHHFRQVKIDFVAGAVLDQRQPIPVLDFTAHRRNAHGRLRAATNLRRPFFSVRYLNPPKLEQQRAHPNKHEQAEKLNS